MIWVGRTMLVIGLFIGLIAVAALLRSQWRTAQAERDFPPLGEIIPVTGGNIHVQDTGDGPAVLLLHGAGGNMRDMLFGIAPALSDYRVIAIDRPGHGFSDRFDPKGATLKRQADAIAEALDAQKLEQVIVVGYSFGGTVALAMALHHPDRIKGVVALSAPSNPWPSETINAVNTLGARPVLGPIAFTAVNGLFPERFFYKQYAGVSKPQSPPEGFLDYVGVMLALRPENFVANSRQLIRLYDQIVDQSKHYGKLTQPVEIIHGDTDASVPHDIHADLLVTQIPNARYTLIPGMGHGTNVLAIQEVRAAVDRLNKAE